MMGYWSRGARHIGWAFSLQYRRYGVPTVLRSGARRS